MNQLIIDARCTLRALAKDRTYTLVAVLSLAVGIGAGAAVFALVNAILLRSLPTPNPQELRVLRWTAVDARVPSLTDWPARVGNRTIAQSVSYPLADRSQ